MTDLEKEILGIIELNIEGLSEEEAQYWVENDAICSAGAVSSLIYYSDTIDFFDKHEEEILDLATDCDFRPDYVELGSTGFKNQMAWFAFEALKDNVYQEMKG